MFYATTVVFLAMRKFKICTLTIILVLIEFNVQLAIQIILEYKLVHKENVYVKIDIMKSEFQFVLLAILVA